MTPPTPLPADTFNELDRELAALLERLLGAANPSVAWATALTSRALRDGHTCLQLATCAGTSVTAENEEPFQLPPLDTWCSDLLAATAIVGQPGEKKPLILDTQNRLFLGRLWRDEDTLAGCLRARLTARPTELDPDKLGQALCRCFPLIEATEPDWQRVAAFAALRNRFTVISGGPGTGKTRTAVIVLGLLLEQAAPEPLRIALATPTGKAAARLQEAIRKLKPTLPLSPERVAQIPEDVQTIHRLLGLTPEATRPRFDEDRPLPIDVLLVDEASMVDLALMTQLLRATPPTARLILLGDRDQLPAVEAGNVLAELSSPAASNRFPAAFVAALEQVTRTKLPAEPAPVPLVGHVVQLRRNYRFGESGLIHRVAQAINRGGGEEVCTLLRATPDAAEATWDGTPPAAALKAVLREHVLSGFGPVFAAKTAEAAFALLNGFRILCALREGPWGSENINRLVTEILREAGLAPARDWYRGRQVMVTANDYGLRLFNGDVGVAWPSGAQRGDPAVHFVDDHGGLREVPPLRLPPHEDAYALTIHKSQGSEFDRVLIVLPPVPADDPASFWAGPGRLLTRELLYTALTRARREVRLWATGEVLSRTVTRRVERESGLAERLRIHLP